MSDTSSVQKLVGLVGLVALMTVACATGGPPDDVTVAHGDSTLSLEPISWCNSGGCSDGSPQDITDDLGVITDNIALSYPHDDWTFSASLVTDGTSERPQLVVTPAGDGEWTITPPSIEGRHRVDVFGRGPGGDSAVSFWLRIEDPSR